MPLYDLICGLCGGRQERYVPSVDSPLPICCGQEMKKDYMGASILHKWHYPAWVDRMDDIHKRQADNGERLRIVQPWEIGAS